MRAVRIYGTCEIQEIGLTLFRNVAKIAHSDLIGHAVGMCFFVGQITRLGHRVG